MHFTLTLALAVALKQTSICLAAPQPKSDTQLLTFPDADGTYDGEQDIETPELGVSHVRWKCADQPSGPSHKLVHDECAASIKKWTQVYPPGTRADRYTLTHDVSAVGDKVVVCPAQVNANTEPFSCELEFNYKVYPSDRDIPDQLQGVASFAGELLKNCEAKEKFWGGEMEVLFGSFYWKLALKSDTFKIPVS